jgi:hypothetical protein
MSFSFGLLRHLAEPQSVVLCLLLGFCLGHLAEELTDIWLFLKSIHLFISLVTIAHFS